MNSLLFFFFNINAWAYMWNLKYVTKIRIDNQLILEINLED